MQSARQSGQLLVEFSILLPLYAVLLWTLLWFGWFGSARVSAEVAARNASMRADGWSAPPDDPDRQRLSSPGNVRSAQVRSQRYRPSGRSPGARLSSTFAPMLQTREGVADIGFEPLPYPHPGRGGGMESRATFVVDPVVDASGWGRRAKALFGIQSPPSLKTSR